MKLSLKHVSVSNSFLILFLFFAIILSSFLLPSFIFAAPISETGNQSLTTGGGMNASVGTNGTVTTTTTTTTTSAGPGGGTPGTGGISGSAIGVAATTTTTAAPVVEKEKITAAAAGTSVTLNVSKSADLKVDQIKIDVKNAVANVEVQIKESTAPAGNLAISSASGLAYKYLEITKTNITDSDISGVKIKFKVEKSWLTANGIDASTIVMKRLVGTTWTDLPTVKTSEDSTYIYFEATSPGLSLFAITGQKIIQTTTTTQQTTGTTTTTAPSGLKLQTTLIVGIVLIFVVIIVLLFVVQHMKKPKEKE
jgi:PGF-pre-PGF domain-containing protein